MARGMAGSCLAVCCLAGGPWIGLAQTLPSFEVASAKVTPEEAVHQPVVLKCENGRLTMRNIHLNTLLSWAYEMHPTDLALPDWADKPNAPHYDIDARADSSVPQSQVRLMLQQLLAERFQFAAHREMREGMHLVLRVGKGGPKLKDAAPNGESAAPIRSDPANLRIICRGATLAEFLFRLWAMGSGRIYDQTGLSGRYDFTLDYANYVDPAAPANSLDALKEARVQAMRAQLGLDVAETKIRVDTLVVNHMERVPSEN